MFHIASFNDIKVGNTTDIYFRRTKEILEKKGISKRVVAEITASSLPKNYRWGIFAGLEEIVNLLKDYNIDVYALPEGSIFYPKEPVIRIEGDYKEFCELETPLLGLACQASGIATKTARLKKLAGEKIILSFGIRRMHPAISPMIDRSAYIAGADGFSGIGAEKLIGKKASGTMPHALIIVVGDQIKAWKYFDEVMARDVARIALVDTFCDEKFEAISAAENIKNLFGVRLDTPGSRRGNMESIIKEVRWELNIRGFSNVKIFVSGGIDEDEVANLSADGFGIGTAISNAKTIDFAMDIVEVEGKPITKRGKFSGKKQVYRCKKCLRGEVVYQPRYSKEIKCKCGGTMKPILKKYIEGGKVIRKLPKAEEIRKYVINQLKKVEI